MNATIEKFGYPNTCLQEYEHWLILLRPQQATLGALIIALKSDHESFGSISAAQAAELSVVANDAEHALASAFAYDKINYLMLMMIDPHVHFHVLPRYETAAQHAEIEFLDLGWPGPPRLDQHTALTPEQFVALQQTLAGAWPAKRGR